jgi:hypothetical protein
MRKLLFLLALIVFLPHAAHAATMNVLPPTRSVSAGDTLTVRVSVNTAGVAINEAGGTLTYPSDLLDVVGVSKASSIFTLWVEEPAAGAGGISWDGGVPTPGYSGADGTIVTVTFRAKKAGSGVLALSGAAVRANDGLGTNVLTSTSPASFSIGQAPAAPPASPVPVAPAAPSAPAGVTLSSKTHPDQNAWYSDPNPVMEWTLPSNADAIEVLASDTKGETPTVSYKPSVKEKQIEDLADGTWYFNLRYRANGVWSSVSSYRLNIDATPPAVDTHSFVYDGGARSLSLSVAASDKLSGVAGYDVMIDGGEPKHLSPDAFAGGPYLLPERDAGTHTATLRIYDRAGNYTDLSEQFTVPVSVLDTPVFMVGSFVVTLFALLLLMGLISLLSLAAAVAACWLLYKRTGVPAIRKRANRQMVHRAFGLMRQDLEKHVRALRKARDGKELTKAEADLGEGMNSNLNDLERYLNQETDLLE